MSTDPEPRRSPIRRPIQFMFENSLFLALGTLAALIWANLDSEGFRHFTELSLIPSASRESSNWTVHFLINDVLMALFFALAAKEVWEALLPGGALSNPRKAATPLLATLGGIVMPAGLYLAVVMATGRMDDLGRGWAVPTATDIAFSYLFARWIFGTGHPAIAFLLLLAIADDAAGLIILASFYPQETPAPYWLVLTIVAVFLGLGLNRLGVRSFWWYLLGPGVLSWVSFHATGIHAALGLVPIIPTMPHASNDLGPFAEEEEERTDTLNEFEHWWKRPVELILGLFGLVNAGVAFESWGAGTIAVATGLILGKPLGIAGFALIGQGLGLRMPDGMGFRHLVTLGMIAGIGFTVALFVSTAAFPNPGPIQDSIKMGALGSFGAGFLALGAAKVLRIRPGEHRELVEAPKSSMDSQKTMTATG